MPADRQALRCSAFPQPIIKIWMIRANPQSPLHSAKEIYQQTESALGLATSISTYPKLHCTPHGDPFGDPAFCGGQDYVDDIREMYTKDWASPVRSRQQMAAALYFIDKLALRAGHEKDEDEADTVGCCTLKVRP